MSGHSKWSTIKRKKEKTDAQRAKIFTKLSRELMVAVKEGGADPEANSKLKDIMVKAKANNVPNDNVDRIIKKASSSNDSAKYEEISYEGFGPGGVAVMASALTDNRNRTASNLRHYFDKFGAGLGTSGSVSWQFEYKGAIVVSKQGATEDKLMEDALECGALDFLSDEEEVFIIHTNPNDFSLVRDALEKYGYEFISAEKEMIPSNWVSLTNEADVKNMNKLIEYLEDDDDVQDIWHNWENEE